MIGAAESSRPRTLVEDTAQTILLRLLLALVGFAASVPISRGLGPAGRGQYYLPVLAAETLVVLCALSLEHANVYLRATRGVSASRLFCQGTLLSLVMGGLGALALPLAPAVLPDVFQDTPMAFLLLMALALPFLIHARLAGGLLLLEGKVTHPFRAALLAGMAQLAVLLGLFLLGVLDVVLVLGVYVLAAVLNWALVSGSEERSEWIRWDGRLLRESLKQALPLHLGMVLLFLHLRLDLFMVKAITGTVAVGLYSLSVALAESVLLVTDSLAIALLPRQVGNTLEESASLALRAARTSALIGTGLAVAWAALGMAVIHLAYGPAFARTYAPFACLLPGMVFLGMQRLCGGPILRAGRPGKVSGVYAASLACNAVLNLWWIPAWGPLGAALASSVSYGVGAYLFLRWTARIARVDLAESLIPTRSDWSLVWRRALGVAPILQQGFSARRRPR